MARWTKRAVVLGVVTAVGGIVGSACADNGVTIFIRQVQVPESGQCSYTSDPSSLAYMQGHMDLMLTSQYRAVLLVGNQMVPRGKEDMGRAESARVRLTEAEIRVEYTNGEEVTSFTIPGYGFMDPATGSQPGWGLFGTVLVDSKTTLKLREKLGVGDGSKRLSTIGRIVAVVKVFGETLGGGAVESGEFRYPIEVCYGCMLSFPSGRTDLTREPVPNCYNCGEVTTAATAGCLFGQDASVDCCDCQALMPDSLACQP